MKKSSTNTGSNPPDISPIRSSLKHQTTPLRPNRKLSRKDQGSDVHSSCSTPNRLQSSTQSNGWNSPSDSFPYSQDNRPDVIWDYTSPKLPKGVKRKEIKITVDEFLKNLNQRQASDCNTQSHYIKLLEKWMTKQNTPVCVKPPPRNVKQDNKKRSRRVIEEIKQFMESIQKKDDDVVTENKKEDTDKSCTPKPNTSNYLNKSLDKKSFLEGDSPGNDSTDDLWGDVDNSFIIKATQQLDVLSYDNVLDKNLEVESTIPETITSSSKSQNQNFCEMGPSAEINFNNGVVDPDHHAQILLSQIIDFDWDSASDYDDWDNGFIEEDVAFSLIPDEVLCGANLGNSQTIDNTVKNTIMKSDETQRVEEVVQSVKISSDLKFSQERDYSSKEISFGCSEFDKGSIPAADASDTELFNNFDDDSFGDDDAILCKPEVLSWMDEVESKLSQSIRCTPEEIEKKKVEAIQRRKRKSKA